MSETTVAKFGGTSMGSVARMLASAKIVVANPDIRLALVSATSGTTSQLVELAQASSAGNKARGHELLDQIKERHLLMASDLRCDQNTIGSINKLLDKMTTKAEGMRLLREASLRSMDSLFSIGERLSSLLFTSAIKQVAQDISVLHIDSRDVLITDDDYGKAEPQVETIKMRAIEIFWPLLDQHRVLVGQGYIGKNNEGITTTLGRGGSDYSAALFAEALGADKLEIWTDVSGISTTDPRITEKAFSISEISFEEAAELATFGAKVLHPATLWPAMRNFIPVYVGNSFAPEQKGTWIRREVAQKPTVRALACRRNQKLITLTSLKMLHSHGFLERIFGVLSKHQMSVDLVTTSEISVAITLDCPQLLSKKVLRDLEEFADVKVEGDLSIVAVIGNGISQTTGLTASIFRVLEAQTIRLICQGASFHNLCFLITDEQTDNVIKLLHERFLEISSPLKPETQPEVSLQ